MRQGIWFDDTDWLSCKDMCNEVHNMHLSPCDMVAKERLFNGTVSWKTDIATRLNARGQIPIFSSINKWNATPSQGSCPRNEQQVTQEMAGLSFGRFYEGWSGTCAAIAQAQAEAEAGIAVFVDRYTAAPLDQYTVAAFLMAAGNQSFLAVQSSWTDPGTKWHPEYFDQPLGVPTGPATRVSGTSWHREFAHVTVDLDCKARSSKITGWKLPPLPPPPPPYPPPPPQPPAPAKGQWGAPWYCISCGHTSGALLKDLGRNVSLPACQAACVGDSRCHYINFGFGASVQDEACQLYSACEGWDGKPAVNCDPEKHGWWTTFQYGR